MSTLIEHKSTDRSYRFNQERQRKLDEGFEWSPGVVFQTDEVSRGALTSRATSLLAKASLGISRENVRWRTAANTDYVFEPDEFLRFYVAMDAYCEELAEASWSGKDGVDGG